MFARSASFLSLAWLEFVIQDAWLFAFFAISVSVVIPLIAFIFPSGFGSGLRPHARLIKFRVSLVIISEIMKPGLHSRRSPMSSLGQFIRKNPFIRIAAGFVFAALVLGAIGWVVTGPYKNSVSGFDSNIRYAMRQIQSPMWTSLFLTLTKLGSTFYLTIIGSVAGIIFIFLRWFRPLLLFIIVMAGQAALHHGAKWLFARPRPTALMSYREVESFSFPSGHALSALCMYGAIAWIVTLRIENPAAKAGIWIFTLVFVFLIGLSRVYIGIHHASDVVAGFLGGLTWLVAVVSADRRSL